MNTTIQEHAARLSERLLPVLLRELPPDAASSRAIALALLAAQCAPGPSADFEADIHLLPSFIDAEHDRGSRDDLPALVRRFVQGERPQAGQTAPVSGVAQRRARLRQLQRWGVDLSLIEMTLRQSPTERIANMERQLRLVRQLQQAARDHGQGSRR